MSEDRKSQTPKSRQHPSDDRSKGGASTPETTDDHESTEASEPDALKLLVQQLRELGEDFSYYVAAKTDSVQLSLRNLPLRILFAALCFVAASGLIVVASTLLLNGIAEGLAALFGDRSWAGKLMTGCLSFAVLGIGVYCTLAKRKKTSRERTGRRYEQRRTRQQAEFGHNVSDQAAPSDSDQE